jgi:hypothetical protein
MDGATGKVRLSEATRSKFALVGEVDLSCFAQMQFDRRASDVPDAAVRPACMS